MSSPVSRVRGGEAIRSAAHRIRKFKGRDFLLWNLASLLNRSWPKSFSYTDSRGLRFRLDLTDPGYRALYLFGQYEWDLLWAIDHLLERGDTFVEAGTSVGVYTAIAAQRVGPGGKVFGFEPLDSARAVALEHAGSNRLENVTIESYALGSEAGSAEIFQFSGLPTGHSSLANLAPGALSQRCEIRTLDSVLGTNKRDVRLIKLDVEGSELNALEGAARTLEESRARVIVEANEETASAFGYTFADISHWFTGRDYRGFVWHRGVWTNLSDTDRGAPPHNALFVHSADVAGLDKVRANHKGP